VESNDTRARNLGFYDDAYSGKSFSFLRVVLKQLLSYDQLSKTRRNLRLAKTLPIFKKHLSVLDYGFGLGTLLLRLPRRHQIVGAELSGEAIRNLTALSRVLRRDVALYSLQELAEKANTSIFDLIFCSHVIEHVEDERGLLKDFHNMLGNDGYLLLNVPINEVWIDPNHVRKYTRESTNQALTNAGFRVQQAIEADRCTAWILHHEYVSRKKHKFAFRVARLLLGLLPVGAWEAFEFLLPKRYRCQQLLILAQKE
jgi:2-polyprenyl-3-methyl-5-hydroxy-6-metoxy-1,4-benzoquinol methylase